MSSTDTRRHERQQADRSTNNPYVNPTGEGYLTTLQESHGTVSVTLGTVGVPWEPGDVVYAEVRGREAVITGDPPDDLATEYLVRDGPSHPENIGVKSEVLDPLGVSDGERARVYDETPEALVVVTRGADRPTCDAAGARLDCPSGEVVVTEDGHRVRAVWHPSSGTTRTALFRLATSDDVAVLQHIRTVRHTDGPDGVRSDLDPDASLADIPRCRRSGLRELGLKPAQEGAA